MDKCRKHLMELRLGPPLSTKCINCKSRIFLAAGHILIRLASSSLAVLIWSKGEGVWVGLISVLEDNSKLEED